MSSEAGNLLLRQTVAAARGDLNLSVRPAYKAKRCTAKEADKDLEELIERTEALNELSREKDNLFAAWLAVGYRNREALAAYCAQHGEDATVTVRKTSSVEPLSYIHHLTFSGIIGI